MLLVSQMLEAEGFHPTVRGRPLLGVGVVSMGGSDAFEVIVPPEEAEAATELLARIEREYRPEVPDTVAPEESASPCPKCGSLDKVFEANSLRNRYLRSKWRRGWLLVVPTNTWRCVRCDHRW